LNFHYDILIDLLYQLIDLTFVVEKILKMPLSITKK